MAIKLLLLSAVVAVMIARGESGGLMGDMMKNPMVQAMLPPGCEESLNGIIAKAKKTFKHIQDVECGKLCKGKPAKAASLWPHEKTIMDFVKSIFPFLKNRSPSLDFDKICPKNLVVADIWPIVKEIKTKCVKGKGEFDKHPNICKATQKDFPETEKCVKEIAMREFNERMARELPMECAGNALKKYCNKPYITPIENYYFNTVRKDYTKEKGHNPWQLKEEYFKGGCSGKLVPAG